MRRGSFLDLSDRRSAWIRWLIIGLVFLALLVVAARVASAGVLAAEAAVAAYAAPDNSSCPDHQGHANGKGCSGALGCHVVDVQADFAVAHPEQRPRLLPREPGLLESQDIAPLFHPPKRLAPA